VSCSLDLLGASIIRPGGVYETRGDSYHYLEMPRHPNQL